MIRKYAAMVVEASGHASGPGCTRALVIGAQMALETGRAIMTISIDENDTE